MIDCGGVDKNGPGMFRTEDDFPTNRFTIYMDKIITKCLIFLPVLVNQQKMKRAFIFKVIELGVRRRHI